MGGEREQPGLMLIISTKSPDPHSVMSEVTDYARQIRDGVVVDESFVPVIYEVPDDIDPLEDESVWKLANAATASLRSCRSANSRRRGTPGTGRETPSGDRVRVRLPEGAGRAQRMLRLARRRLHQRRAAAGESARTEPLGPPG
jgi:Phage Terminase